MRTRVNLNLELKNEIKKLAKEDYAKVYSEFMKNSNFNNILTLSENEVEKR